MLLQMSSVEAVSPASIRKAYFNPIVIATPTASRRATLIRRG